MKKKWLRPLGSLLLLAILIWRLDWQKTGAALLNVQWGWWVLGVGTYFASQLVSSRRWQELAAPLGLARSWRRFVSLYMVGNFFNQLLPTSMGGDVARAWHLAEERTERWPAFLSVFADRLSGLAILILLACAAACFVSLPWWVLAWIGGMAAGLVVGVMVLIYLARETGPQVAHGSQSRIQQIRALLQCYRKSPALLARSMALSIVVQGANVLMVWMLCRSTSAQVSLSFCGILMPLVTLLTLAPISINGVGVREGGTILLLTPLGVAAEQSVVIALLWLGVFASVGLVGAVVYTLGSFSAKKAEPDDGSLSGSPGDEREREHRAVA